MLTNWYITIEVYFVSASLVHKKIQNRYLNRYLTVLFILLSMLFKVGESFCTSIYYDLTITLILCYFDFIACMIIFIREHF